jgi:hypothetical protein
MHETPETTGRPIIVLGMARSGTSLIGDMVHRWGAYGGDVEELKRGNVGNPNGYFENRQMQHFLLTELGLDFWTPMYAERLRERAQDPECRAKALQLIGQMTAHGPLWFWKEPYLSVTLPFWKGIWGDAVYIIPVRDPYDSAVSYNNFSIPQEVRNQVSVLCAGLLEWHCFMLSLLEGTDDAPHKIFVPYERLVTSPETECRRLCGFLDRHRGAGLQLPPDRLERMIEAVDPKLHRNSGRVTFFERPEATAEQKALYRFLERKIEDPDAAPDPAGYPMYPGWREYLGNLQFFRMFYAKVSPLLSSRWLAIVLAANRQFARLMGALRLRPWRA